MAYREGLEALTGWFANKPFRVRDISSDGIDELADLVGIKALASTVAE